MRSTSSSLDVVEDGEAGGGVVGDGARALRGTGRWAPGGGAGRATHGLGPNQARYRDNMPPPQPSADCEARDAAAAFIRARINVTFWL